MRPEGGVLKGIQPIGLLLVLYIISHPVNAGDQKQYFEAGKAFGKGRNAAVSQGVTTGKAQAVVPGYNTNPPETTNYGLSDLVSPRQAKISGCASASLDPKVRSDQECIAVNFTQRAPSIRPQINIDPAKNSTITRADAVLADPLAYAGKLDGSFSQCTTKTTTTPAQYTTESCTSLRAIEGQQCTMDRQIDIDTDANYQCDKTLTAFTSQERQPTVSTSSCSYGRQVNIDADSNFQCDKTLTAFTSQERQPTVSTSSCTYGRQVNIDEDSRFQCDQTVNSYEDTRCDDDLIVQVSPGTAVTNPISAGAVLGSKCTPNCNFGKVYVYAKDVTNSIDVRYVDECKRIRGASDTYSSFYLKTLTLPSTQSVMTTSIGASYCGATYFAAQLSISCPVAGVIANCTVIFWPGGAGGWEAIINNVNTTTTSITPPVATTTMNNACLQLEERSR
ncbi:MAG: hypothetical protein Q8O33_02330 [Pseudomonadota bacterium]|nr:hypothetical protein [Pseudomonadota bacterium]